MEKKATNKKVRIYTRTGDQGETSLFSGEKVSKHDLRVEAYGTVDELNSAIGWALMAVKAIQNDNIVHISAMLETLQRELFEVGADLATPPSKNANAYKILRIGDDEVKRLEKWIDKLDEALPTLRAFIMPGGTEAAARIHIARTVCRRAERIAVRAVHSAPNVNVGVVRYLNRLNDLLFVMARFANHCQGVMDVTWER